MKTAGSIIALVGGIVSILAGLITLFFGGFINAFMSDYFAANTGYIGIGISLLVVIFSVVSLYTKSRVTPVLLIISSIGGFLFGGKIIAIFMVLGVVGGVMALFRARVPKTDDDEDTRHEHDANRIDKPLIVVHHRFYTKWWFVSLVVIILIIAFGILVNSKKKMDDTTNGKTKNDLNQLELSGNVRLFRETTYTAIDRFGEVIPNAFLSSQKTTFNDKGNITEITDYTPEGYFNYKTVYKYNNKGNKIEMKELILDDYYFDGRVKTRAMETYEHDSKGNLTATNFYDQDGKLTIKHIFKYNDKRNLIEKRIYDSTGSLTERWAFVYDAFGNKIEESIYDGTGSFLKKRSFKNDDEKIAKLYKSPARLIEEKEFDANNALLYTTTYAYGVQGNVVERSTKYSDGSSEKWTNVYDYGKSNNWIKAIEYKNGIPLTIIERNFNETLPSFLQNTENGTASTETEPKDEAALTEETEPVKEVTPKKEAAPKKEITPKKEVAPKKEVTPKKETAPKKEAVAVNKSNTYNVLFDNIQIRENPSFDGRPIGKVNSSDKVEYLNEKSSNTDTATLKKKSYSANWYKIKTSDNTEGWIFGAAIGK